MHCIDDKPNGIILNHNADWSGDVRLAWYTADERCDPGPPPPSLRECWCRGPDLVAGRFTPALPPAGEFLPETVPGSWAPAEVITRAVALAVESYLRHKLMCTIDDLFIRRSKL